MPALTDQQRAAVAAEGNVLVMAGAGTGKTSTLVARVLDRVGRPSNPVPIDRILMVTFTEAAAAEMRRRLREGLEDSLKTRPDSSWLTEQIALLDTAPIGTLHSFCLRLVREHFHVLGLDPDPTVLEVADARRLAHEVADSVLEPHFRGTDPESAAVRDLLGGLLDHRVENGRDLILRVHDYASTLPDPGAWLARQHSDWSAPAPGNWRRELLEEIRDWATHSADALGELPPAYAAATACRDILSRMPAEDASDDAMIGLLEAVLAQKAIRAKRNQAPAKLHRELVRVLFEEAAFLRSLLRDDPEADPLVEDWNRTHGGMAALLSLAIRFNSEFARAKRELGAVDYHDLEQFALQLLVPRHGRPAPIPAASQRYDLVFVDECQDINAVQDAILTALSGDGGGGNRFLVGDVKQSIYRFRLANPHIFQHYARKWHNNPKEGHVIPLTENFRSAGGILDFVNALFPPLMRREVGGVDFDHDAALQLGPSPDSARTNGTVEAGPRVEVTIRLSHRAGAADNSEAPDSDEADPAGASEGELEARLVAARLGELRGAATPVWDRELKSFRPVAWRDMAVLLRAPKTRVADFAREFRRAGIPLNAEEVGFFERSEISDLVSLLQLLDNPLQDLPTLAVLRSPLVGIWEPDELAVIRMASRRDDLWTALGRFHELGLANREATNSGSCPDRMPSPKPEGDEVFSHPATRKAAAIAWPKVDRFLGHFARWRRLARRGSVTAALEAALDDTGYETWLAVQEHAEVRLANVRCLLAVARRFDASQRAGLLRLLGLLKSFEETDALTPASATDDDAVRLLSIHRSKGLEFPIVALAGLGTKFNARELEQAPAVLDEDLGLCPLVVAADGTRYPSLPLWRAQRHQRREMLGEELRLLYVAVTRACDRLLLFGSGSSRAAADRCLPADRDRFSPAQLLQAKRCLDWLGPLMPRFTGDLVWHERAQGTASLLSWRIVTNDPPPPPEGPAHAAKASTEAGATADSAGSYPHDNSTREPAKVSVTGLRRRIADELGEESAEWPGISTRPERVLRVAGPAGPSGLSAAERGTAHHRFLELVELSHTGSSSGLAAELARLRKAGRLSALEAAAIDIEALARFWSSDLGASIRARTGEVRRELPFTLRLAVADLRALGLPAAGLDASEFVVAQGVIDLAVVSRDEIWIVDFKTDHVPVADLEMRVKLYSPQLAIYAMALERIFQRRVTCRWIHFLATGRSVPLP